MKKSYYLLFILLFSLAAHAQNSRYTILLKDKEGTLYSMSAPSAFLSSKSIERRNRQKIPIDQTDLPISADYLDSIKNVPGATVINTSKWLNNVLVEIGDPAALDRINTFPFVLNIQKVGMHMPDSRPMISGSLSESAPADPAPETANSTFADTINYGMNSPQVHIHEGQFLHNLNLRGQGMTIAMLDAGYYKYKTNPALDSVRMNNHIAGEYDFVHNETSVNEDDSHGANCFTILAANRPGFIVGTAPDASYWLFKTEDVTSEKPVEEQYWVVAAERADSAGVDMITSSLGYSAFDDPSLSLSYSQRDGKTSPISRAANLAAKKGILVMISAGNSGNQNSDAKFVDAPADADSVMAVGAIDVNKMISSFSSWGPNGAGHIKPNIVSVGSNTVYANPAGDPVSGNGTSYSNPNIAGLVLCLWQGFPDFTNMEIIDAVQRSSDRFNNPDLNRYGYGIPNFKTAYEYLSAKREARQNSLLTHSWITVYPTPFRQSFTIYFKAPASGNAFMRLMNVSGQTVFTKNLPVQQNNFYTVPVNPPALAAGVYYLHYNDGKNKTIVKVVRQ